MQQEEGQPHSRRGRHEAPEDAQEAELEEPGAAQPEGSEAVLGQVHQRGLLGGRARVLERILYLVAGVLATGPRLFFAPIRARKGLAKAIPFQTTRGYHLFGGTPSILSLQRVLIVAPFFYLGYWFTIGYD